MIKFDVALELVLQSIDIISSEEINFTEGLDRVLAEDIRIGDLSIARGSLLKSMQIGLLAGRESGMIKVYRKPKVAILSSREPEETNTHTLYNQILKCGGIPENIKIARDKPEELEEKLQQSLNYDLILTSGGVSTGDYDLVKYILAKMGTDIKFWKVIMEPEKSLIFGKLRDKPIFGLPSSPGSSMVSFEIFVRPALLKMLGRSIDTGKEVDAVLEEDIKNKKGVKSFLQAQTRWDEGIYLTRITEVITEVNSLIILPEEEQTIAKGTRVLVRFLD